MADYSIEFKIRKGNFYGTSDSLFIQLSDEISWSTTQLHETTRHLLTTNVYNGHIYSKTVTAKFIDRLSSVNITKPGHNKYVMEYITIRHNGVLYYYNFPNVWMYQKYHIVLEALEGLI